MKVFLDGTENGSEWRVKLVPELDRMGIDYFDPTVLARSKRSHEEEIDQKNQSDFHLYLITPLMDDFENISELIEDSNKNPQKTIFSFMEQEQQLTFNEHQVKSLKRVGEMVEKNGGVWCRSNVDLLSFFSSKL
ncbi:MAG: hypothetical protein KI790_02540 [Cyclobacteriaceae bacterium]|nr:hypothetical protein [Cyclobacteriaceae bacterium HetDA_MAG_MS6]